MITAEIIRTLDGVDALAAEWERLFGVRAQQPSLSFEWARAILRNHLRDRRDWFVVVLRRDDEIVGLVPMMSIAERVLGFRVVTLQTVQELYNTHGGLLLDAGDRELVGAWLRAATSATTRWDLLRLSRLLEGEPLVESFTVGGLGSVARVRSRVEQPAFHLRLPSSYSEYLAARSAKFRNYLRRSTKKLEARGRVALARLADADRFSAEFDELMEIERGSWKHDHGTAISAVPHQAGFYEDLGRGALSRERLHLTFLRVQGRAVAYNLGLVANGCYYYLKTSYLEELRAFGVATIGRAKLIEQLIAEGVKELDFPGALYDWERQWSTDMRWHRSLLLFNRKARGSALWAALGVIGALRGRPHEKKDRLPRSAGVAPVTGHEVKVLTTIEELEALAPDWRALGEQPWGPLGRTLGSRRRRGRSMRARRCT